MGSNMGTQPAPVQYPRRRRSFAGPILLIAIGVLFLLGNLHLIQGRVLWHYFALWWPALIILWGLVRLMEYALARRQDERIAGVGGGAVALLVVLIVVGLIASGVEHMNGIVNLDGIGEDTGFLADIAGQPFNFTQQLEQDFPAGASLKVVSDRGDVILNTWDSNRIKVEVTKKIRAQVQSEADQADASTRAQITVNGNEVLLNANVMGAGNRSVRSDMTVYLPRKAGVNVSTRHGDVSVTGRTGGVQISLNHGDINLTDINGTVILAQRGGSLRANKVDGDLTLDGRINEFNVEDVTGNVRMNGDAISGLRVARVGKQMGYHSSRTDMDMAGLPGRLTMQSGDMSASEVVGPLRLVTRSKDVRISEISGDVHIETTNGDLDIQASKLPLGSFELTNRNSDIRLSLPAKANFRLDAIARHGGISSEFADINVSKEGHTDKRATGTVGSGTTHVQINNDKGDIEIRKIG